MAEEAELFFCIHCGNRTAPSGVAVCPECAAPAPDQDGTEPTHPIDAMDRQFNDVPESSLLISPDSEVADEAMGRNAVAPPDDSRDGDDDPECDPFAEEFGDIEIMTANGGVKTYHVHLGAGVTWTHDKKSDADGAAAILLDVRNETKRQLTTKSARCTDSAEVTEEPIPYTLTDPVEPSSLDLTSDQANALEEAYAVAREARFVLGAGRQDGKLIQECAELIRALQQRDSGYQDGGKRGDVDDELADVLHLVLGAMGPEAESWKVLREKKLPHVRALIAGVKGD